MTEKGLTMSEETYNRAEVYEALRKAVDLSLDALDEAGRIDLLNVVEAATLSFLDGTATTLEEVVEAEWNGEKVIAHGDLVEADDE